MTKEERLTKYMDECHHEVDDNGPYHTRCKLCNMIFGAIHMSDWDIKNCFRSFITPKDMLDLTNKLIEKEDWNKFEDLAETIWFGDPEAKQSKINFTPWLISNAVRFCDLVDLYLRDKKEQI